MILNVIDTNFKRLGVLEGFTSCKIVRKWGDIGSLVLEAPAYDDNIDLLKNGNILYKSGAVETEGYIIERIEIKRVHKKEILKVVARDILSILNYRIIDRHMYFTNNRIDSLVNAIITQNFSNPSDPNRKLEGVYYNQIRVDKIIDVYDSSYKPAGDEIIKLCKKIQVAPVLKLDLKNNRFNLYLLESRSNNILLAGEAGTLLEEKYVNNTLAKYSTGIVFGEGEGEARKRTEVNTLAGWNRRELYVDARDLQQKEQSEAEYQEKLKNRGLEKIKETEKTETHEGLLNSNLLQYNKDWHLGDTVTVTNRKLRIQTSQKIIEVEETYSKGIVRIKPKLGAKEYNIIDRIIQEERN